MAVNDHELAIQANCDYFDIESFNRNFDLVKNSLSCFHVNVRSCGRNLDETLLYLDELKCSFSFVVLTETWLTDESAFTNVPGYKAFHVLRQNKRGGGVTILVSGALDAGVVSSNICDLFEYICVEVRVADKKM